MLAKAFWSECCGVLLARYVNQDMYVQIEMGTRQHERNECLKKTMEITPCSTLKHVQVLHIGEEEFNNFDKLKTLVMIDGRWTMWEGMYLVTQPGESGPRYVLIHRKETYLVDLYRIIAEYDIQKDLKSADVRITAGLVSA